MAKIKRISGLEVLDSRGNPTVEAEVELENGIKTRAITPSGASTGKFEAVELRDNNKDRYQGKGVKQAVENVSTLINDELKGREVDDQRKIDWLMKELDGTDNKNKLGANAILAVSMAAIRAAAISNKRSLYQQIAETFNLSAKFNLPRPFFNILNGGQHANNKLSIQEFMLVPLVEGSFARQLRLGAEVYHQLKKELEESGQSSAVGDEGGFAPQISDPKQVLELIIEAGKKAGYQPKTDFAIGLDVAASEFSLNQDGKFGYKMDGFDNLDSKGLANYLLELADNFPIISIEDPLDEEDWQGWQYITSKTPEHIQIIGDDLFVTNKERLNKGIKLEAANSILIKLNQIGTVSETVDTVNMARENNFKLMISHRSGETCDSFIADFAVGIGGEQIKSGSLARSDRLAKYNQLLRIEKELNG